MRQQGLTPGGCNVHIRSINSYLSWLHEEGQLEKPLRAKLLRVTAVTLTSFSDTEIRQLTAFKPRNPFPARAWVLTLCLMDTGIRINEALTLEQARSISMT